MRSRLLFAALLLIACDDPSTTEDAGAEDAGAGDAGAEELPPRVSTALGDIIGERGDGALGFRGIPFAAPPVGDLRFAPPAAPAAWTEPLVSRRPSRCVQEPLGITLPSDEDCLYLNVHTPDPMPTDAPVMVWVHGGGFIFGEGLQTDDGTAGDRLARDHGVVVVSMNYRLGAFGFLAHPELTAAQGGTSGNYGLMDQRAALEWVRDHIDAFGGDPDNVTLFGESAGGNSVCAHLVSPASRGLFHRAIIQSGLCDDPQSFDLAAAETIGEELAATLSCDGADPVTCLRGLDAETIKDAAGAGGTDAFTELARARRWWATVDGAVLPTDFRTAVADGEVADVPVVIGWNADEGTLFVMLAEQGGEVVDEAAYDQVVTFLAERSGVEESAIRAQYPVGDYPDPGAAIAAATGHFNLACSSRRGARLLAAAGHDVRVYHFTYPDAEFQLPSERDLGAFHSGEIQYVFGHPASLGRSRFSGDDLALHQAMSGLFTLFASGTLTEEEWPLNTPATDLHVVLDREITTGSNADAADCALWEPATP